jgi:hypothetical protein
LVASAENASNCADKNALTMYAMGKNTSVLPDKELPE